jgi:hypothetical protein
MRLREKEVLVYRHVNGEVEIPDEDHWRAFQNCILSGDYEELAFIVLFENPYGELVSRVLRLPGRRYYRENWWRPKPGYCWAEHEVVQIIL